MTLFVACCCVVLLAVAHVTIADGCIESASTRRSVDVVFYWRDVNDEPFFPGKLWNSDPNHRAGDKDGRVFGNPTGTFYRRCLKPGELAQDPPKTCLSIYLPDEDPDTKACEQKGVGPPPLEKGEAESLTSCFRNKLSVALTMNDLGCTQNCAQNCTGADWFSCLTQQGARRISVELTPENSGIIAPMHVWAYFVEVREPLKSKLQLPNDKGKLSWLSCEEATQDFVDAEGNRKWQYIHAAAVLMSELCPEKPHYHSAVWVILVVVATALVFALLAWAYRYRSSSVASTRSLSRRALMQAGQGVELS
jgi:hypothetical protein